VWVAVVFLSEKIFLLHACQISRFTRNAAVLMKWLHAETRVGLKRLTTEKYRTFQLECLLFHPHAQNLNINIHCAVIYFILFYFIQLLTTVPGHHRFVGIVETVESVMLLYIGVDVLGAF
jgi:hypothetical protein